MSDHCIHFPGGIETYETHGEIEYQCARCGSSVDWFECWDCGGDGTVGHDCGEDVCCCRFPVDNVVCHTCRGRKGWNCCMSSREWCEAHPLPGREHVKSSAMSAEAWEDQ